MSEKPLIAHVLYRFDIGGMERFILTLVNATGDHYRHALICLDEFGPLRIEIADRSVPCVALHKKPGKDWRCYIRLWRALRSLAPDLVQTYNFGALDVAPIARLAGVRHIVHAERGRDASDPQGANSRYLRLHHWVNPFIACFLAVSHDLERWLIDDVRIDPAKVKYIGNGIDIDQFTDASRVGHERPLLGAFAPAGNVLIVNVARLDAVKDQAGLITAFRMLCDMEPDRASRLRLAIIGGGAEHDKLQQQIEQLGLTAQARLLGMRSDVPALLAEADLFVLSSIAEGMPGSVLEAMASGLPVVSTRVGGVGEVVVDGATGTLVAPSDPGALADALRTYVDDEALRLQHGCAGRECVGKHFSLPVMLSAYSALYDCLLASKPSHARRVRAPVGLAGRAER